MRKDDRLSFRIAGELKKEIEAIGAQEGRSMAQVSEALLLAGLDLYRKTGTKVIQRWVSRSSNK
jgi:hypothetical protein